MATALYRKQNPEVINFRERLMDDIKFAELSDLARDLVELCALGVLEAFTDPQGTVRYRPIEGMELR